MARHARQGTAGEGGAALDAARLPRRPALVVRATPGEVWAALAGAWRAAALAAVGARGVFIAALSGGRSPEGFLRLLAREPGLPWGQTELLLVDERLVPEGSPARNGRLLREALTERLARPPAGLHLVSPGLTDPEAAAQAYERELRALLDAPGARPGRPDLVLLGLGADGHTASLFPGDPALRERERWVAGVPAAGARGARVSLTPGFINRARAAAFLVTGAEKREALARLLAGDPRLPATLVQPEGAPVVFADRPAAGRSEDDGG